MFTSQHYHAIADVLNSHNVDPSHCDNCDAKDTTLRLLAYDLATMFEADNPRFKADYFYTACGFANKPLRKVCKQVVTPKVKRTRKPKVSPAMKRFLAEKFPTHAGTSEETLYYLTMGRWAPEKVDVTLAHGDTVIHCNDRRGEMTAAAYLKELSL